MHTDKTVSVRLAKCHVKRLVSLFYFRVVYYLPYLGEIKLRKSLAFFWHRYTKNSCLVEKDLMRKRYRLSEFATEASDRISCGLR